MRALVLSSLLLLTGCAGYMERFGPGTHPDTRLVIPEHHILTVNPFTDKIIDGAPPGWSLDEFRCPDKTVLYCERVASRDYCECRGTITLR